MYTLQELITEVVKAISYSYVPTKNENKEIIHYPINDSTATNTIYTLSLLDKEIIPFVNTITHDNNGTISLEIKNNNAIFDISFGTDRCSHLVYCNGIKEKVIQNSIIYEVVHMNINQALLNFINWDGTNFENEMNNFRILRNGY